jgi:hypothetical protein
MSILLLRRNKSMVVTFVYLTPLRDANFCSHLVAVALAGPGGVGGYWVLPAQGQVASVHNGIR